MELAYNFVQVVQDAILRPDFTSVLSIFFLSTVNELTAVLPYTVILSSQLLFIQDPFSVAMFTKLLLFIAIPMGIGAAIGSSLIYGLAYFGGKPGIEKFGKYFQLSWEDIKKMESKFKGSWYDEILFLALRLVPLLPSFPVSAVAGILRMSPVSYFILTIIGFTLRMMIMFTFVGLGMGTLAQ
ncbi:MAG: VTT domain-containing protein, partial [bacterium]|nr:VTT domain-containing protein [bacterium]